MAQLLEFSPLMRKSFKEGLPGVKRRKKTQKRTVARVQASARPVDVKAVEIEVTIVDKVVPNVLIDGGSGLNIMPLHTMEKLGLSLTGPSPFVLNMADQSPARPLGQITNCKIITGGEEYLVTFHVIRMHTAKESFPLLLGRPWLRMANATIMWGGDKPSIVYGPYENPTKVRIKPLIGLDVTRATSSEGEDKTVNSKGEKIAVNEILVDGMTFEAEVQGLKCLGPNLYHWSDNGEYTKWLQEYPNLSSELEMGVNFIGVEVNGRLTPLIDIDVHVIEGEKLEGVEELEECEPLGGSLKFKTDSSGITMKDNIFNYSNVPSDWYRDNNGQLHDVEEDWKYVIVEFEGEEPRQIKMGCQFGEAEIKGYCNLVREYWEVFLWSYKKFKAIPPEIVDHQIAVDSRLTDRQSLRTGLYELTVLDKSQGQGVQHIEATQRRRKVLFDKRNKTRVLQPGMLVSLQDDRKVDFPSQTDVVWLGPYLVSEVFLNNSVQLETLNGQLFPT